MIHACLPLVPQACTQLSIHPDLITPFHLKSPLRRNFVPHTQSEHFDTEIGHWFYESIFFHSRLPQNGKFYAWRNQKPTWSLTRPKHLLDAIFSSNILFLILRRQSQNTLKRVNIWFLHHKTRMQMCHRLCDKSPSRWTKCQDAFLDSQKKLKKTPKTGAHRHTIFLPHLAQKRRCELERGSLFWRRQAKLRAHRVVALGQVYWAPEWHFCPMKGYNWKVLNEWREFTLTPSLFMPYVQRNCPLFTPQ